MSILKNYMKHANFKHKYRTKQNSLVIIYIPHTTIRSCEPYNFRPAHLISNTEPTGCFIYNNNHADFIYSSLGYP